MSLDSLNIQSSGKRKKGFHRKSIPDSLKRPCLHAQTGFCFPIEKKKVPKKPCEQPHFGSAARTTVPFSISRECDER